MVQPSLPLPAKTKSTLTLMASTTLQNRGRNLGPSEHVSLPTLCRPGNKALLNLRRWEGGSLSVPESFGASVALQCCLVRWQPASPLTARTDDIYSVLYISFFNLPRQHTLRQYKIVIWFRLIFRLTRPRLFVNQNSSVIASCYVHIVTHGMLLSFVFILYARICVASCAIELYVELL